MNEKLSDFITNLQKDIINFEINMKNLNITNFSREKWMETFLNWMEWQTEMHDECWK